MKILLISSVQPGNSTGGEVVLYRHFSRSSDLTLTIATDNNSEKLFSEDIVEIYPHPLLSRLTKTRVSKWAHDVRQCVAPFYNYNKLLDHIKYKKPDLIVTVAHGELCWLAQYIARNFNLPLVTFFHDWWPDLAYVHSWTRKVLERHFKRLYQQSQLAFCVSEEMQRALGKHPNSQVLFPIPEQLSIQGSLATSTGGQEFKVVYAGNMSEIYRPMIQCLWTLSQEVDEFNLKLFGPPPDWLGSILYPRQDRGIYGGYLSRELLRKELCKANALLAIMSFNEQDKRRTQLSFPSKLLEYCQFGKPIIIWGPEYCSAVRWAREYQAALVVTSPLAQDLVKAIQELSTQPKVQKSLGDKACEMAQSVFNPEKIQRQFSDSIKNLLTQA
ncbi:MAG: glycosyltransferase [Aphanothece sp. CMT-3BRIN-NPC111]|nr:glycosyltransferase [Aphanothece sp. CMT-3BRIN-NPC111]